MNGAVTVAKMEPRGSSVSPLRTRKRSRTLGLRKTTHGSRSGRSNGRAECREKKIGIEPKGSTFFLTFPLIGHCYRDEFPVDGVFLRTTAFRACATMNFSFERSLFGERRFRPWISMSLSLAAVSAEPSPAAVSHRRAKRF